MNSRKRILMALNHQEPDRVPIDIGSSISSSIHIDAYKKLINYLGIKVSKVSINHRVQQIVWVNEEVLKRFQVDTRHIQLKPALPWKRISENLYKDEWGIIYKKTSSSKYYGIVDSPLKNMKINDIDKYSFPDPFSPKRFEGIEEKAKSLYKDTKYAIVLTGLRGGFFGLPTSLRDRTQFYMDLILNQELVNVIFDKIMDFYKSIAEITLNLVGKYIDALIVTDDLGMQNGPIISPELYRKLIKPRQKEIYDFIKQRTKAKIWFHSCGSVYKLMTDFIENGIDALNPIQVSAKDMDTKRLKKEFGEKITFWGGGCDTQNILAQGTPLQVKNEVKRRIKELAPGGGFIFTPVHNIQYDVKPENICALYDAAIQFGKYPIDINI